MKRLPLCLLLALPAAAAETKPAFVMPPKLELRSVPSEWKLIVSPDGSLFATGDRSGVSVWRFGDTRPAALISWPLDAEFGSIVPLAISRDNARVFAARRRKNDTIELAVLDVAEEKVLKVVENRPQRCTPLEWSGIGYCDRMGPASFSMDGTRVSYEAHYGVAPEVIAAEEKTWDLEGRLLSTQVRKRTRVKDDPIGWVDEKGGSQTACRETAAGALAVRSDPSACSILDCTTGKRLVFLDECKGGDYLSFRFTPDGRRVLAGTLYGHGAAIWDAADGRLIRAWTVKEEEPWRVGASPLELSDDGRFAVEVREIVGDARVQAQRVDLLEAETGKRLGRLESAVDKSQSLTAVASDGSVAFLNEGGSAYLWRFGPGRKPAPAAARTAAPVPMASARPTVPVAAPLRPNFDSGPRPDDLAVIVGVEGYSGIATRAPYAERDAEAFKEYVRALGVPERNIVLLTGAKAVRSALAKNVEAWLPRMAKPGSRVYFYFSGHGAPDVKTGQAYLVPWDGDPDFLETTAYPLAQLYRKLSALPAKQVLVALDSCFSGAGGRSVLASGARPLVAKVETGAVPAKLTVLAAAASNEISGSLDDRRHGAFTYFLLEGLNAGKKTPEALKDYLVPLVQDEARRLNRDQTPQLLGDGGWTLR